MSFQRSILVAIATLITVGMTQVAFVAQYGCGGCGTAVYAPVIYATPIEPQPIAVGCGGCGAPVTCCAPSVAAYAAPVANGAAATVATEPRSGMAAMADMAAAIAAAAIAGFPRSTRRRRRSMSSIRVRPLRARASWCRTTATRHPWNTLRPRPIRRMRGYGGTRLWRRLRWRIWRWLWAPLSYAPHAAYGAGYYRPHMMGPHYYGGRPMMHRPYWRG